MLKKISFTKYKLLLFLFIIPFFYISELSFAALPTELNKDIAGKANCLIEKAKTEEINLRVTSGIRSFKVQDDLWRKGRCEGESSEERVTNAKAGESFHNYGMAFDVVDDDIGYKGDNKYWNIIGGFGKECGLKWGGDWKNKDKPHFQEIGISLGYLEKKYRKEIKEYRDKHGENPCDGSDMIEGGNDKPGTISLKTYSDFNLDKEDIKKVASSEKDKICEEIRNGSRNYKLVGYDGGLCSEDSGFDALKKTIQGVLNWLIGIAFLLATIAIFWVGFLFLTAGENPSNISTAKEIAKNILIGLVLIGSAWLIVDWIFILFGVSDDFKFTSQN